MPIVRDKNLRLALSEDELRMAHELADAEGSNVTELLRRYIRKAHAKKVVGARGKAEPRRGRR